MVLPIALKRPQGIFTVHNICSFLFSGTNIYVRAQVPTSILMYIHVHINMYAPRLHICNGPSCVKKYLLINPISSKRVVLKRAIRILPF
jgi:hypothetical protein